MSLGYCAVGFGFDFTLRFVMFMFYCFEYCTLRAGVLVDFGSVVWASMFEVFRCDVFHFTLMYVCFVFDRCGVPGWTALWNDVFYDSICL